MRYTARVVAGRGEGHKLGFPTLNLEIPPDLAAHIKPGIYAGWVWLEKNADGAEASASATMPATPLPAALHYGPVPVFGIQTASLEAHIINKDIPTPPKRLSFELVKYLREVKYFNEIQGLVAQIRQDVQDALAALEERKSESEIV